MSKKSTTNEIFHALDSEPRRVMLVLLEKSDLTVGEIASHFDMSLPAVSKHLNVLAGARLVKREKKGRVIWLRLMKDDMLDTLDDFRAKFRSRRRAAVVRRRK